MISGLAGSIIAGKAGSHTRSAACCPMPVPPDRFPVVPGLTRDPASCPPSEVTGPRIKSGATSVKGSDLNGGSASLANPTLVKTRLQASSHNRRKPWEFLSMDPRMCATRLPGYGRQARFGW